MSAPRANDGDLRLRLLILAALGLALAFAAVSEAQVTIARQPLGIDFLPLWTGAKLSLSDPGRLYDFEFVTQAQAFALHGGYGLRPFVYPPTTLLPILPFSALPFGLAYPLWTALTAALMALVVWKTAPERKGLALFLAVLASPVVTALLVGQTSFLVGALIAVSLWQMKPQPVLAGLLLGLAVALKPTALVLAPICLIAGGHWRALFAAAVSGALAGLATLAMFGPQLWFDWLAALPRFQAFVFANEGLLRGGITPTSKAVELGLTGPALAAVRAAFAVLALTIAWLTFRRTQDLATRLVALVGAGLLVTPYTMQYDATLLTPAVVLLVMNTLAGPRWTLGVAAYVLLIGTGIAHLGAYALVALVLLVAADTLWRGRPALHPATA